MRVQQLGVVAALLVLGATGAAAQSAASPPARAGADGSLPAPGTVVIRAAEGDASESRDRVCAQRVRVAATGREYLLRRSETDERTARRGDTTSVTLVRAVGRYALLPPTAPAASADTSALWVDCRTSRVLARPAGT